MSKSTVVIDYNDTLLPDRSEQTYDSQKFAAWHDDKENIEIMKKNLMTDVDIENSTNQLSEQQVVDKKNYSEVYWLQNDNKRFSENITNALKYILGLYDFNVGYISNHIKEWHGIVDSIDLNENKFKVLFVDPSDKEGEYLVEFNISNIQYESDKELLINGAHIVWIYGQERRVIKRANENKLGPITNVSKIIVRRTRALNRKQLEEADENAQQWTRFFNGSET